MEEYKGGSWVISDQFNSYTDGENDDDFDILSYAKKKDIDSDECMIKDKGWSGDWELECTQKELDEKQCWFTDNFKRQCDDEVGNRPRPETPEECLQECLKHPHCDKAHWHPGNQIWQDDERPVCFMFGVGSGTCNWGGGEGPDGHPGAKMINCDPPTCKLEKKYEPNLCVTGKEGAYCDFDEDHEKTICFSCEFMETPLDCSDSNDEKDSTCLQERDVYGRQFISK